MYNVVGMGTVNNNSGLRNVLVYNKKEKRAQEGKQLDRRPVLAEGQ